MMTITMQSKIIKNMRFQKIKKFSWHSLIFNKSWHCFIIVPKLTQHNLAIIHKNRTSSVTIILSF